MEFVYIYILLDIEGQPRYLGKTNNPARRFKEHRLSKPWVASYSILVSVPISLGENWRWHEKFWLLLLSQYYNLENEAAGGMGPDYHSQATRQKISEAGKGKIISEEQKQKISQALKGYCKPGRKNTAESNEKRRATLLGRKRPPEVVKKMIKYQQTPEAKLLRHNQQAGKPKSSETVARMKEAQQRRRQNEQQPRR